jgi:hypothetical protein
LKDEDGAFVKLFSLWHFPNRHFFLAQSFHSTHISTFFNLPLPSLVQPIFTIFHLLSLLVSHAHMSGLTSSTISAFSYHSCLCFLSLLDLLRGSSHLPRLTPPSPLPEQQYQPSSGASFHQVHETYLGNANAFERLLLSYIRLQRLRRPLGSPGVLRIR